MKSIFKSLFLGLGCLMATTVCAADATFTMASIFDGNSLSFNVTTPTAATVSSNTSKSNAKAGKLGSDGHYFEIILKDETFTAAVINGYINTTDQSKNWAFQFSTDGGKTWGSELTQANDGNKTAHDITVGVAIPADANGFRVVRRAGTSTLVNSITLSLAGGDTPPTPVAVESVALNKTTLTLEQGQAETLTATVIPDNAANKNLSWDSDNKAVATVDEDGKVSALTAGTANITVTTEDGGKTATCVVTVTAPAAPIEVESISIKEATTIAIGSSETLTVTYTPSDANTGKEVTWSSSDESVATVDANGKVTGLKAGTATIIATSKTNSSITASCAVTVKAVAVTGVTLTPATATVQVDGTTTLSYSITPDNATDKTVSWSSDDENVATVDANGKVTGVAEGTAIITVKTNDGGFTASCTVEVTESSTTSTGYTTHAPEKYEEPKGYNTPLSQFGGREYEVYYVTRDPSGNNICIATNTDDKVAGISNGTTTTVKARDNWFELLSSEGKGGDSNAAAKDEFKLKSVQSIKMQSDQEMVFQVKGFDQFNFYGNDNNKDASKGKYFTVYIDDKLQAGNPGSPIEGYAIHRYDMSPAEHVIRLVAIGASNSKLNGFSLRVSNDPLVRHVAGPKAQTVYQTKDIERVAFRVRRAADYRLVWKNNKSIPGVSMTAGGNDSVYIDGIANAATGVYTYTIEALNSAGEVKSSESGTITIQTHIFDAAKGNDFSTNIAEEIKPLNFIFYASEQSAITLNTDISGLALTFVNDSTVHLTGTPALTTIEGVHTYTITAAGGNTISGVITVVVPDPYFEPFAEAKTKDRMAITFTIVAHHASDVTVVGLPEGFTVSYDTNTDEVTISGTPNVGGTYPKTFEFTATASPRYIGKTETSKSGKLIVIDPEVKAVLVTTKTVADVKDEPIAKYISSELHYDITFRQQDVLAGSSYDMFDLVLISEDVDANHPEVQKIIRGGVDLPILNMKAFTYSHVTDSGDEAWGEADNGSLSENGKSITVLRDDHPIFSKLNKKQGDKIQVLDSIDRKGLMPIKVTLQGSLCLATALTRSSEDYYGDGELETFLHEKPAGKDGHNSKYICFPIALSSSPYLSAEGKTLLKTIIKYLTNDEEESVELPIREITMFKVGDIEIPYPDYSIILEIDTLEHPELADLSDIEPEIELASPYTHIIPPRENLSIAQYLPIQYVVSDYIHREVYEITVVYRKPQGIEDVYTAGEWVNIFDIYGRKVTTTNEDIYSMPLPRGMYIVVTANGQTLKIMR